VPKKIICYSQIQEVVHDHNRNESGCMNTVPKNVFESVIQINIIVYVTNTMEQNPLEKVICSVSQSPPFMEPKSSILCSQQPIAEPHIDPGNSSPYIDTLYPEIQLNKRSSHLYLGPPSGLFPWSSLLYALPTLLYAMSETFLNYI